MRRVIDYDALLRVCVYHTAAKEIITERHIGKVLSLKASHGDEFVCLWQRVNTEHLRIVECVRDTLRVGSTDEHNATVGSKEDGRVIESALIHTSRVIGCFAE